MRTQTKKLSLTDRLCEYGSFLQYGADKETRSEKRRRMEQLLRVAMKKELTERQRECMRCYYCEDMRVEDIAERLGVRPTTVYKHIRLARKAIKKCIVYL